MKIILTFLSIILNINAWSQVQKLDNELYLYTDPKSTEEHNCGVDIQFDPEIHENLAAPLSGAAIQFIWPFDKPLDDGLILVNYVDNLSGAGIKDYNDDNWAYDGHKGTDICVNDFRAMDRFVPIKAAAAGTVVQISVNNFDRNTELGTGLPANLICIRHADGTYAYYYHLMKSSIVVKLGEYVLQDQLLGYVGSSGNSTDPHLHFEPGSFVNGNWIKRDPWSGYYNQLPSLWQSQYAYVGFRAFTLHDMGVFTKSSTGGNFSNIGNYLKERILAPNTVSGYTDTLGFWIHVQGNYSGKQIRFEMRKSDGTLYKELNTQLYSQTQNGYLWWTPTFNPGIDVTGNWYVRVLYDNVEKARCFFNVQLLTSYRPKMYPVAARCFRRSPLVQKDTLRVRPVRTNMQYELVNAPPNVTLTNDSIISIWAFDQISRVRNFMVIASIGGSATSRDTMLYKLIDTTKSNFSGNTVQSIELNAKIEGLWDGSEMVSDTVTVIVRYPIYPFNVVDSARVLLNPNGYAIANFFNTSPNIYYYLVVKHRNSIETWSKSVIQFDNGYPIEYDFTTSRTKAYGDNLKFKNWVYCIYSGDVTQDGFINLTDVLEIHNASLGFVYGYKKTDVTGDNVTDLSDVILTSNNANSFIQRRRP